jgi:hypothetical protein
MKTGGSIKLVLEDFRMYKERSLKLLDSVCLTFTMEDVRKPASKLAMGFQDAALSSALYSPRKTWECLPLSSFPSP